MMYQQKGGQIKTPTKNSLANRYAEHLREASNQALATAGVQEYHIAIAGKSVSFNFAGDALVEAILPAFGHLIADRSADSDLSITLWDTDSTGISLPELPWKSSRGEAWKINQEGHRGFYFPNSDTLIWFDREKLRAYVWISKREAALSEDNFSPLLFLWAAWLEDYPFLLTHTAAIGNDQAAALIAGISGSGKSNTSLIALNSGLNFLADDVCFVSLPPEPIVFSLYASAKIFTKDIGLHPYLKPTLARRGIEKTLFILYPHFANQIRRSMPLKALIAPVITDDKTTKIVPAKPSEMIISLAPSTLLQLHTGKSEGNTMRLLTDIARQLPGYKLYLGADIHNDKNVLADLLDDADILSP